MRVFDYCDHFIGEVIKAMSLSVPPYDPSSDFVVTKQTLTFKTPLFDLKSIKEEKKVKRERKAEPGEEDGRTPKKRRSSAQGKEPSTKPSTKPETPNATATEVQQYL